MYDMYCSLFSGKSKEIPQGRKKKSMKIFPCYIVLTKIDRYLDSGTTISYRTFRKTYRECLNICKNVNFSRKLEAGQDVFNVKVPSKHKNYQAYMELNRKRHKSSKSKSCSKRGSLFKSSVEPKMEKKFKDLIEKYKKSIHGRGAGRVMRSVQWFPKDFMRDLNKASKTPVLAKFISEARQQVLDETEREIALKRDFAKLKHQIEFKRSTNKAKKQYRLHQAEHIPPYFRSGTSVVSGRVRKMNTRYSDDFARSKDEEQYFHSLSMITEKLKRDKKRMIGEIEDERNDSYRENFELIIDNPESLNERSVICLERQGNELKALNKNSDMSNKERERINAQRRERYHKKQVEKAQNKVFHDKEDGVIIKDIPDECSVLNNLLESNTADVNPDPLINTEKPYYGYDSASAEPFSYVKSLLKRSSDYEQRDPVGEPEFKRTKSLNIGIEQNNQSTGAENNNMDPERARLFRIPDKVRQLFVKKDNTKVDMSETENSDKDVSQTLEQNYSMLKLKDNELSQQRFSTGTPVASHLKKSCQEIQKFVITSKGLAKPIVHVGLDVTKPIPDFMALTTHAAPRDCVSGVPKPVLLFENTGDIGKIPSVYPKAHAPTTALNSTSLIKIPVAGNVSSGDGLGTNVRVQTSIPGSSTSDSRSQVFSRNASSGPSKSQPTLVPVKSPNPVSSKEESNNSYYYFQVSGKNIIIPVKEGPDQQKAVVLNSFKTSDAKVAQTNTSTVSVKSNLIGTKMAANKQQQPPTFATSYKLGDNVVALIPQANNQQLVVPLTPVRQPISKPITAPDTQVIRVSPGDQIDSTPLPPRTVPAESKQVVRVGPERKQVLRMYPDGQTVKCTSPNPIRLTRPSLINSFNGKRFALIPSTLPQNVPNKNSLSNGTTSSDAPLRFSLVPTTLTGSTTLSSTILKNISLAVSNSTLVPTAKIVSQNPMSPPGRPKRAKAIPVKVCNSETSVKTSYLSKGSVKPNIIPTGLMGIPSVTNRAARVPDTTNGAADNTSEKEEEPDKTQEKAMAFAEATTAREEKLRKLKELLKERSMAVDKLRQQRKNMDSDSDDT